MVDIMDDTNGACEGRGEQLVAHIYGEDDPGERAELERHLARCSRCRQAMSSLTAVRGVLAEWTPPVPTGVGLADRVAPAPGSRSWRTLWDVPGWAQAAAAILILGVAAGFANVEVRYGQDGFVVRTGWRQIAEPVTGESAPPAPATVVASVLRDLDAARPWQSDLAQLSEGLRRELAAATVRQASSGDESVLRQVREIVGESEARQRRELALRLAEVIQEGQLQRRVDLQRIDRTLGAIESSSRLHQLRYNEAINNLAVRAGLAGRE
jgi:hypothetical protein